MGPPAPQPEQAFRSGLEACGLVVKDSEQILRRLAAGESLGDLSRAIDQDARDEAAGGGGRSRRANRSAL